MKVVVELPPGMPACFAVVMHHSQNRNLNRLGLNAHTYRIRAIDGHRNWRRICCLRTSPPCRPDNPLTQPTARNARHITTTACVVPLSPDRHVLPRSARTSFRRAWDAWRSSAATERSISPVAGWLRSRRCRVHFLYQAVLQGGASPASRPMCA